jgi:hypothetical protein
MTQTIGCRNAPAFAAQLFFTMKIPTSACGGENGLVMSGRVSLCLTQDRVAYSVDSPPPCGEGLGWGSSCEAQLVRQSTTPTPAQRSQASAGCARLAACADPPRKGEGKHRVCRSHFPLQTGA